jgi:hypothetical protein
MNPHPYYGECDRLINGVDCAECQAQRVGYRGSPESQEDPRRRLRDLPLNTPHDVYRAILLLEASGFEVRLK